MEKFKLKLKNNFDEEDTRILQYDLFHIFRFTQYDMVYF
jgi:hypothetical protein